MTTNLIPTKANTNIARWYAVQVASSCEKKVKATLEQRSVTLGVNNRIIEIEIPQTPGIKIISSSYKLSISTALFVLNKRIEAILKTDMNIVNIWNKGL